VFSTSSRTIGRRYLSGQPDLKTTLKEVIPAKREYLKKIKTEHGNKVLGEVKVENAIGGMRYVTSGLGSSCDIG